MLALRARSRGLAVHLGCLLLLALTAFVLNRHASGTVVAQGDFYQTTHFALNKFTNLFTWFHHSGQGQYNPLISTFPFYAVQWLLESLGASSSTIADFLVFQFLVLSYLGMLLALRMVRPLGLPGVSRLPILPLLYAVNPVSFLALSWSWGYLHHLLIYWFAPVLLAITVRLMLAWEWRILLAFVPLATVSTVAYNNLGFLNGLVVVQSLIAAGILLVRAAPLRAVARALAACGLVEVATSAYLWLPFLISQRGYASKVTDAKAYGGDIRTVLHATSPGFGKVLGLDVNPYHFPAVLPSGYGAWWLRPAVTLGTMLPAAMLLLGLVRRDRPKQVGAGLVLATLGVVFLAARVAAPVESLATALYQLPPFILLRSPEKVYIFLPALLALAVTATGLPGWLAGRARRSLGAVTVLLVGLPFFLGLIPVYMNERLSADLLTPDPAGYSISVHVPPSYRALAEYLNAQPGNAPVVSLPSAIVNSPNWGNYPSWGLVGHDFTLVSLRRPYVSANIYDHPTLETGLSFETLNERRGGPAELLALLQRFGAQYVLFHEDTAPSRLQGARPTQQDLAELVRQGKLAVRLTTPQFELYELSPELVTPLVTVPGRVRFQRTSPVEVQVDVNGVTRSSELIFRQSHNPAWRLQLLPWAPLNCTPVAGSHGGGADTSWGACAESSSLSLRDGLQAPFNDDAAAGTHRLVENYANAWTLSSNYIRTHFSDRYYRVNSDGTLSVRLRLYFIPQSAYYWAAVFVILLNLVALGLLAQRGRRALSP